MTRVAVIGAGAMGRNHVRVFKEMPGVDLVGVADFDRETACRVADSAGCLGFGSHQELLEAVHPQAVTVAVPTNAHHAVVTELLQAACHVLVEKPIAATVEEADELIELAAAARRVLAVGHIERFNPVVQELKRRLREGQLGRVFQLNARRLGPFPHRIRDVGVVVDLATHDLDIMRYLTEAEVVRAFAETKREIHTTNEDLVSGLLRFDNGIVGLLEINWLTPSKIREITVTGERGMLKADYLTQDLYFHENAEAVPAGWDQIAILRGVSEGSITRYAVGKREPLRMELEDFIAAAAGQAARFTTGLDGREALRLALAMIRSGELGETVWLSKR
jgi:UDP-N-acetylglucosamine 3-dehydrogenase